jgi:uncharacterized protein
MTKVKDNTHLNRYELEEDGYLAFADYRDHAGVRYIDHVEAAPELRGKGAAGRLMQGLVALAAAEDITLQPVCSYAVQWMQRHKV